MAASGTLLSVQPWYRRYAKDGFAGWFDQLTISDGTTPELLARPESPT